jgi:Uma2 family endonuclease
VETVKSPLEQRVLLRNVSWETYKRLLEEREERQSPRFFYDRGVLEIVSPSTEHEEIADLIAFLVRELAAEWEIDVRVAGHTTFRREDLSRGFEPDGSFYLSENAARVRGKANIDLDAGDPPPDLVVEVDRTSQSLDKLPIYARLGVPEVWRYVVGGTGRPEILGLSGVGDTYEPMAESRVLAPLATDALARFVEEGLTTRYPSWVRRVREWARGKASG